jgi:UDP-N-acetylglucosamine 2-epimerase
VFLETKKQVKKLQNISFIVGTRPQIIKSQPVIKHLSNKKMSVDVIHTGQHFDYRLSQIFFDDLQIVKVTKNLNVVKNSPIKQIADIIVKLEKYFQTNKPDLVIIPGDTTSAIAASITASKLKIKSIHLEAGARSNQYYMAEEINRRMIDHSSNVLLAPTKNCLNNLKNEHVFGESYFVGDTMYDLFLDWKKKNYLQHNNTSNKIFMTIHRAENIDNKNNLRQICLFINKLSKKFEITLPIHPHTQSQIKKYNFKINAKIISPLKYTDLMKTINNSNLIITDSGGLQKEAYWMQKPCITIRESTEWVETIAEKANYLMSANKPFSLKNIEKIASLKIKTKKSLFGSGKASSNIYNIIKKI